MTDLTIVRGDDFLAAFQWEQATLAYLPITSIEQSAPAKLRVNAHGLPNNWRVAIQSAKGMRQINAANNPPKDKDFKRITVVDTNYITLNNTNSLDYQKHTGGGVVVYRPPVDITGFDAVMKVYDKEGGTVLLTLTPANGGLVVDVAKYVIGVVMTAAATAALTWKKGVYDLDAISPSGRVTTVAAGSIVVNLK